MKSSARTDSNNWWSFSGGPLWRSQKAIADAVRATAKQGPHPARHVRVLARAVPTVLVDWGTSIAKFQATSKGILDVFEGLGAARRVLKSQRIVAAELKAKAWLRAHP
jgi:hypothetical protein